MFRRDFVRIYSGSEFQELQEIKRGYCLGEARSYRVSITVRRNRFIWEKGRHPEVVLFNSKSELKSLPNLPRK